MARRRGTIGTNGEQPQDKSRESTRLNEEDVLLPIVNPLHPDDWPCFVLKDAIVYCKDGETPGSLLNAELDGPMVVCGRLEVDKEFRQLLKPKRPNGSAVEVTDVNGFSIGIGPVTIWARGKAGWFEIRPAPSYQRIYDKMVEGITLHYFLTESYENKRASAGNPTMYVDEIFKLYSEQIDNTKSAPQVAQLCEEHAAFLLSQMRRPTEPVRWTRTSFYQWLTKKRPDIHARYNGKADAHIPIIVIEDDLMEDQTPTETRISDRAQGNPSTTAVIVRVMKELYASGAVRRQSITIDTLSRALCERYDVRDLNLAREVIEVHAKTILTSLEKEWTTSPIYSRLEKCLSQPVGKKSALRREAKMIELRARYTEDEALNDEITQKYPASIGPPIIPRGRRKRSYQREQEENISSLKPVPGAVTRGRRHSSIDKGKGKQAVISESDTQTHLATRSRPSDDEERSPVGRPIRRAGKKAALRLAGSSITQEESENGRSNKRPKISHSDDYDESEESSSDISRTDENEEIEEVLTVVTHSLPSTSPQGPNGLWTCPTDGCKFLVGAADKPEAQAKIRAHFLEHAEEISKMENLVLEESKPYLPTAHLLEKLRALGEAARHSEERRIAGKIVQAPIKRRMAA